MESNGTNLGGANSEEYQTDSEKNEAIIDEMQAVEAYLSTPKFVKYLCDIAEHISESTNREEALVDELRTLNNYLPASVYIPFVQNSYRNYAVLHVPPRESRVFPTKERCPYMVVLEMYRPEEISRSGKKEKPRKEERKEEFGSDLE